MIVDPDFLDHWKTTMLCDILDDSSAPLCVIRLWGHCQQRRNWKFDIPAKGIKALCKFKGDAEQLDQALQDCEFISRDGQSIEVIGWDEHNATLIANWKNGQKGGRPKKEKPSNNPSKTHGLPVDNPTETHGEPIGEDRIGSDTKDLSTPAKPDAKALRKRQAIELMTLWNEAKAEHDTNWTAVDDPEHTSSKRYSSASARAEYVKQRLKRNGKPHEWQDVHAWFTRFYSNLASDPFYSGRPNDRNPSGYKATFEQVHAEEYFIKAIERLTQGWNP